MLVLVLRGLGLASRRYLPLVLESVEDAETERGVPEDLELEGQFMNS